MNRFKMLSDKLISKVYRIADDLQNIGLECKIRKYKKLLPKGFSTASVSYRDYLVICKLAVDHDDVFEVFKRVKDYRVQLEHVSKKQGQLYLNIIKKEKSLLRYFSMFKDNDKFRCPVKYNYDVGIFSPTTLRYIKVLMDLKTFFGDLNNFNIVEIGVGYGGQCKIISDVFKPASYTMIDLYLTLLLAKKYLSKFNIQNVIYLTSQQIDNKKEYDLVISNYAFSEIEKSLQDDYIQKILPFSKRGYLTCNYDGISTPNSPYNKEELFRMLSQWHSIEVVDEEPKTSRDNFIIKWDDEKTARSNDLPL